MRVDLLAIVCPDIDVDANDTTLAHSFQDRRVEHEGATVGYARLNDDIRLKSPDDLLNRIISSGSWMIGRPNQENP